MIHGENPFADAPDARDPVRRFRGRLAAPVTIVTAGDDERRTGLTVSSLVVVEGEPGLVEAVIGPTTDLWDIAAETGRFVIHVCEDANRHLSEVFAGIRPNPGGLFAGLDIGLSEWGPVIKELGNRVYCDYESRREIGYSGMVRARIAAVDVVDLSSPLVYFRGGVHSLRSTP